MVRCHASRSPVRHVQCRPRVPRLRVTFLWAVRTLTVMDLGIEDRVAIVTGSSKGIGRSIAERLAAEGANVVTNARSAERAADAAAAIQDAGGAAIGVGADLTDPDDVSALVEEAVETFGTVDILVNNAGTVGSEREFHDLAIEEWEEVYDLNVFGLVRTTREALPYMREQEWGRIVNVASEAGTQPDDYKPHYDSSKAAVINLTKNLSKTYSSEGVLVNAVSPATTLTPLVEELFEERARETGESVEQVRGAFVREEKPGMVLGLGRLGEPEETANVVAFLASEKASYVTGANYRVDGGSIFTMDA